MCRPFQGGHSCFLGLISERDEGECIRAACAARSSSEQRDTFLAPTIPTCDEDHICGLQGLMIKRGKVFSPCHCSPPQRHAASLRHGIASNDSYQLRLEDLLGFRRNPDTTTPLFLQYNAKPLDGHLTPATPFVRLSTGASGVGVPTSLGLTFGALGYRLPEECPAPYRLESSLH
jgi:hypothetical protein